MEDGGSNAELARVGALDGLRGWAALAVILFHFGWEMWGERFADFRSFGAGLVADGQLAVAIFFTLSGYVLTVRRWRRTDNPPLLLTLIRRYLRLTIPIFAAAALFYLVMVLRLTSTGAAAPLIDGRAWLSRIAGFEPDVIDMLGFALGRVYTVSFEHNYGPFLWTMVVELWGSIFVLAVSQSPRFLREPYSPLLLFSVVMLAFFPPAACFSLGALGALLQRDGAIFSRPPGRIEASLALIVIAGTIALGSYVQLPTEQLRISTAPLLLPGALCGVAIVFAVMRSPAAAAFLVRPLSHGLGQLSFPVFLMHGVIIATVASGLVVWRGASGPLDEPSALLIVLASTLACYAAAPLLVPVERFALSFIKRIGTRRASASPVIAATADS